MHPRLKAIIILLLALALAPAGCGEVITPPSVATIDATGVAADVATLNGDLSDLGTGSSVDVSFQWWTDSSSYLKETDKQALTGTGVFSFELTDLEPDTTYHFRAKAVGDGTDYGSARSFKTPPLPG
jgi:hypothetical protein